MRRSCSAKAQSGQRMNFCLNDGRKGAIQVAALEESADIVVSKVLKISYNSFFFFPSRSSSVVCRFLFPELFWLRATGGPGYSAHSV